MCFAWRRFFARSKSKLYPFKIPNSIYVFCYFAWRRFFARSKSKLYLWFKVSLQFGVSVYRIDSSFSNSGSKPFCKTRMLLTKKFNTQDARTILCTLIVPSSFGKFDIVIIALRVLICLGPIARPMLGACSSHSEATAHPHSPIIRCPHST